jgi:hypothetical protein
MVVVAERASRRAWLEVARGPNERVEVNLGPEPVKVGGDPRSCTVYVPNAPAVALSYRMQGGEVVCVDVASGNQANEPIGASRQLGTVTLTVRAAEGVGEAPPSPPPSAGPLPLPQKTAPLPAPARDAEVCPSCGKPAPGPKGRRFCIGCEKYF